MVYLKTTGSIKKAISNYFETTEASVLSLESPVDYESAISHHDLVLLAQHSTYSLSQLIKGTEVYFPPKKQPPPKSKEYLKLMESLKIKQQEDEYQQLIGNSIPTHDEDNVTPGMAVKELREQVSTIINVAVSVGSVAFAVWYWSGTSTHWGLPTRTLLALFAAILVAVAETVVYLGYKNKIAEAKAVELAKPEVKQIITSNLTAVKVSKEKQLKHRKVKNLKK